MNDLVECTRCRKVMINEEYDNHLCEPIMKDCKIIKFTSYFITKNNEGKTLLDITTINGESYMFEEVPEDKEHTQIPYQPTGNTNNNYRRGNRICIKVLST